MTGKDFLVEFPLAAPEGAYTLDTRPIPLSCYVQVKTITCRIHRIKVNLKAAERLVKESKPTFIAIVCLDENEEVFDIHMLHVYDSVTNSILRRLREEQVRGSSNVGSKFISFNLNSTIRLGHGRQAIKEFISLHVGSSMVDYANRKEKLLKELGYDEYRYKLKMRFSALPFEQFVDGLLGLRELPAAAIDHFDRRFGISLPNHELSIGATSTVRIQPHSTGRCTFEVIAQNTRETAKVEGDIYLPSISAIPEKFFKVRLKTAMIDMHISSQNFHVSMHNDVGDKSYTLKSIYQHYKVAQLLGMTKCEISIKMNNGPIVMSGVVDYQLQENAPFFTWILEVIEAASELLELAQVSDYPVEVDEFIRQGALILRAHEMIGLRGGKLSSVDTEIKVPGLLTDKSRFLFVSGVQIGAAVYAFALRLEVDPEVRGALTRWNISCAELLVIEPLKNNIVNLYLEFQKRMCKISGINNLMASEVNFTR